MVNREQIKSAIAQGMGFEATSHEVEEEFSLLVKTITDGWRQGYLVGFLDLWKVDEGKQTVKAADLVGHQARIGPTASQEELEAVSLALLEVNIMQLSELTTALFFAEVDEHGSRGELWFPLDELE